MSDLIGGMVAAHSHASNWKPKVAGASLQANVASQLIRGEIETSLRMPSMCTLWFADPTHGCATTFPIGAPLVVEIEDAVQLPGLSSILGGGGPNEPAFEGEVIALEAVREGLTTYTVVRAYDKLHRLYRGRKSKAFLQKKYGDIARAIAAEHGMSGGTIDDATGAAVHEVVFQHDESDGELLERFAAEYGFVLRAKGTKLEFCAPPRPSDAPGAGTFGGAAPDQLVLGDDLFRYEIGVSAESLVSTVEVRGWDAKLATPVVGTAIVAAAKSTSDTKMPAVVAAAKFGGSKFSSSAIPLSTVGEAMHTANAIANQIASSYATVRATSMGNKTLRAGKAVNIGPSTSQFGGKYVITSSRHILEEGQFTTEIVCAGLTDLGPSGALSAHGNGGRPAPTAVAAPAASVMPGIVDNVNDPLQQGRVKVKLEHIAAPFVTDWLRVCAPGVGEGRGLVATPECGDEVLVTFEKGDFRRGYVLGGLYSSAKKPTQDGFSGAIVSGVVNKRSWTSRKGHRIVMDDKDGAENIEIKTADNNIWVKLDQKQGQMSVDLHKGQSKLTMDSKGNISIEGQGKIAFSAMQDIELAGMNVKITAKQGLEMKGLTTKLEAQTTLDAKGGVSAKLEAATVSVSGSALADIKAPIVKINS